MLLRDALPLDPQAATTTQLIYSFTDVHDGVLQAAFWRVDLADLTRKEQIVTVPAWKQEPVYGSLSPDGQTIAYLIRTGENLADVHLIDSDGTNDRGITNNVGVAGADIGCRSYIHWHPDSSQLAFERLADSESALPFEIGIYDLNAQTTEILLRARWTTLVGWLNADEVLVFVSPDRLKPIEFLRLSVSTQQSRYIAPAVGGDAIGCAKVSPDRRTLMRDQTIIDLTTGNIQSINVPTINTIWETTGTQFLEITQGTRATTTFLHQPIAGSPQRVRLLPDSPSSFYLSQGISPDGRFLVVCEGHEERAGLRTLLYDSQLHRWHVLAESSYSCLHILGWQ
jgi:Tol biopolymer transport system component